MNTIPDVISLEIVSYLSYEDQCLFGRMNIRYYNLILKRIRRININRKVLASKFSREKIHRLLLDPYHQLMVSISDSDESVDGLNDLSCLQLSTTAEFFVSSLIHHVKKVQRLSFYASNRKSLNENMLEETLTSWINNNPSLSLKELSISNDDITHLTVIQNLQSLALTCFRNLQIDGLNIPAYSNLRTLNITSCSGLGDVSCLDRIHDLALIQCEGIHGISCLNHNYKILIKRCENIEDYSHCFRHSKVISIACIPRNDISFDFSNLMEVKDFIMEPHGKETKNFQFPRCTTLRSVDLMSFTSPFSLPAGNTIRKIKISNSPGLTSFTNFEQIYHVSLYFLNISTLKGLSSGNRIVEVHSCNNITDFSPLRHCEKVLIRQCKGFKEASQLRGVKEFIFTPVKRQMIAEDLEGVTCLSLICDYEEFPDDLYSMKLPNSLKKLEFFHAWSSLTRQFYLPFSYFTTIPPHINEVHIVHATTNAIREFQSKVKKGEIAVPNFSIEYTKDRIQFVLKQN